MLANINLVITNQTVFDKVVSDAIQNAIYNAKTEGLAKRWTNAIEKAVKEIETNPFLSWDTEKESLLILSDSSNNIYAANGVCQCRAYTKGIEVSGKPFPCWHRGAARIWRLYSESLNNLEKVESLPASPSPRIEQNEIPLLPNTPTRKPNSLAGYRF